MRLMLKGDLAFLYLSGGETPGIAGRLEVVSKIRRIYDSLQHSIAASRTSSGL